MLAYQELWGSDKKELSQNIKLLIRLKSCYCSINALPAFPRLFETIGIKYRKFVLVKLKISSANVVSLE